MVAGARTTKRWELASNLYFAALLIHPGAAVSQICWTTDDQTGQPINGLLSKLQVFSKSCGMATSSHTARNPANAD
jgi:hypothetical protein